MTLPLNPLKRSYDRKVSPYSKLGGTQARVQIGNSFGLLAGTSCPGATPTCKSSCYAAKLEKVYTSSRRLVASNLDTLKAAKTVAGMSSLLGAMIDEFRFETVRVSQRTGRAMPLLFRIHWDGDFYSLAYARAWRRVIVANPDIQFWAYTRSFTTRCNVVPILEGLDNLALYLSADVDNVDRAKLVAAQHPTVKLAVLHKTYEGALDIARDVDSEAAPIRCPENARRIPLVDADGTGACVACGACTVGRRDVLFASSHS